MCEHVTVHSFARLLLEVIYIISVACVYVYLCIEYYAHCSGQKLLCDVYVCVCGCPCPSRRAQMSRYVLKAQISALLTARPHQSIAAAAAASVHFSGVSDSVRQHFVSTGYHLSKEERKAVCRLRLNGL